MSVATQFDLTRDEILSRFQARIDHGDRNKLTREERESLTLILVDRLVELNQQSRDDQAAIRDLCEVEKELLERGYPKGSLNSVYLPNYTRLLKAAIDQGRLQLNDRNSYPKPWTKRDGSETGVTQTHFALDYLTYDTATQAQLRGLTTDKNNQRQDDLKPVRVQAYLKRVEELLDSEEAEVLAIAIAALTGRRHAEVVAVGKFEETGHPYQLRFEGQQKKADAEAFEIVSLIPVRDLLPVFERFRSLPGVQGLVGLDDDHPEVQAFNSRVNRRVEALFGTTGLVPVLSNFKTVSIHRLRALYGAIAIHFFCANNQHIHRFLQNHLGHVLTKEVGATNSRATDHYFHYYLVKEDGSPITARGIKLMSAGALVEAVKDQAEATIDVGAHTEPQSIESGTVEAEGQIAPEPIVPSKPVRPSLHRQTVDDLKALATRLGFPSRTIQESLAALVQWAHARETQAVQLEPQIPQESPAASLEEVMPEAVMPEVTTPEAITPEAQVESPAASEEMDIKTTLEAMLQRLARLEEKATPVKQTGRKPLKSGATEPGVKPTSAPRGRRGGKAAERANNIFLAVQAWNREHPDQTFAITFRLLKETFGIHAEAAKAFLEARKDDLWELHQSSGVENPQSHNRREGRDVEALKSFVAEFGQAD